MKDKRVIPVPSVTGWFWGCKKCKQPVVVAKGKAYFSCRCWEWWPILHNAHSSE